MRNAEQERLTEARTEGTLWLKWGPYLSERQWGSVDPHISCSLRGVSGGVFEDRLIQPSPRREGDP
jgi:hypothetical protein